MMKMEASIEHVWLLGKHISEITLKTGAKIVCPDLSTPEAFNANRKCTIWSSGVLTCVYQSHSLITVII